MCPGGPLVVILESTLVTELFVSCIGLGQVPEPLVSFPGLVTLGSPFHPPCLRVHGFLSSLSLFHLRLQAAHWTYIACSPNSGCRNVHLANIDIYRQEWSEKTL